MNRKLGLALSLLLVTTHRALAHEGMWTLDNLPRSQLQQRYQFEPTPEWLDTVRLSATRFNDGGSGAFVSGGGLVLTNHHVALGQLEKLSTEEKDYVKNGFFAATEAEEVPCPDLEINVLEAYQEVTDRVMGAVDPASAPGVQNEQRKAEIARIEKEGTEQSGLRSNVVELYQGGEYWLYQYKKYLDVRLVMAPEAQAANFGGDHDNFTFPRHCLDFAFFRIYEDGKPVTPKKWLKFHPAGVQEGDLVFVVGHPGSTDRQLTHAQLVHQRDFVLPASLDRLKARLEILKMYASRGPENERRAQNRILGLENALKSYKGAFEALSNPRVMERKVADEKALREKIAADPQLVKEFGDAWERIEKLQSELQRRHKELSYRGIASSRLAELAQSIVTYVTELAKPNEKRFEEFRDSNLESLRFELLSPAPIYLDLEEVLLSHALDRSLALLGPEDAHVKAALAGELPQTVARKLVEGTKLTDPAVRKALIEGGEKAVASSQDPLIVWARRLDPTYRELRKWSEDTVESVESLEGHRIAQARFKVLGKTSAPDATFTLRVAYGKVAGYADGSTVVPYKTTYYGIMEKAASFDEKPPFSLSGKMATARAALDLSTPVNFVMTNDVVGGNSGSPVVDREGRYVGLIFDGNIHSLILDYMFDEEKSRSIAVHPRGILEALKKVYGMDALVREVTGG